MVVGGVALLVLLGIAGAILAVFASGLLNSGSVATTSTTTKSSVGASTQVGAVAIVYPPEKPLQSTFTFRNIFAPTVKPAIVPTESTTPAETPTETVPSTDVTSPTVEPVSILTLVRIRQVGDAHVGDFTLDGTAYDGVGNGGTIGSSPWKVIEVLDDNSCLMLYGDAQQTITVGQSISK
jgi:hypothetical protein